ncbi:MAG TPA: ribosomal protein S18-alanine N-acetyltransferase [Lachnospiraceae bacterium]|nr:ribosomal protein S18-alanine N-acetyltransferase [Lachnospiraceae bacterium]
MKNRSINQSIPTGQNLTIRPLGQEDVEEVSLLEAKSFSLPWQEKDFWDMVNREDSVYVVGVIEKKIVACCGVTNACGDGDINNVVVEETFRHQGIGRLMMETLMNWGKEIGIENYTLEVRVSNTPAIGLYESLGFVSAGIRPGFYEKPHEAAMIMWKR